MGIPPNHLKLNRFGIETYGFGHPHFRKPPYYLFTYIYTYNYIHTYCIPQISVDCDVLTKGDAQRESP